jgi:hypothetical protein
MIRDSSNGYGNVHKYITHSAQATLIAPAPPIAHYSLWPIDVSHTQFYFDRIGFQKLTPALAVILC